MIKPAIFIVAAIVWASIANAQQIRPITVPQVLQERHRDILTDRDPGLMELKLRIADTRRKLRDTKRLNEDDSEVAAMLQTTIRDAEAELKAYRAETEQQLKAFTVDDLNEEPRLTLSAAGGTNFFSNSAIVGGFYPSATLRLTRYTEKRAETIDPLFVYAGYNIRNQLARDSSELTKTFLFPAIAKRDFVLGLFWQHHYRSRNLTVEYLLEGSLSSYKKDSVANTEFKTESGLIGVKFVYAQTFTLPGTPTPYNASIQFFPYYNLINVQPKYFDGYRTAFTQTSLPATWHTVGCQIAVQGSALQLFVDMKYVFNKTDQTGIKDFQGMTYTIGTMVAMDVLRFQLWP